jgi:hypothetical protein
VSGVVVGGRCLPCELQVMVADDEALYSAQVLLK